MSHERCADCRHYTEPRGLDDRFGACRRDEAGRDFLNFDPEWNGLEDALNAELERLAREERAAVSDGSGYHAALRVTPEVRLCAARGQAVSARRLSDRAPWWLFHAAALAVIFAALALRSLFGLPT